LKLASIEEVVSGVLPLMHGFGGHWCVAGGWAIDLFLGETTRPHEDVELAIFRHDQQLIRRHLTEWTFEKVVDGRRIDWLGDEELKLPIHEIHGRSRKDVRLALEFLLNERNGDVWVYRRDSRIRLPLGQAIVLGKGNVPILCPAIVLLFKAKDVRVKDEADFCNVVDGLEHEQCRWLEDALRITHREHPWLTELETKNARSVRT